MSNLLEKASLVLIPSGYKEDIVYSEIPIDGAGDLSFSRASNGTRVNFDGLVEVTPWNLLQQSETFDNATWTKIAGITSNVTTAPNGTTTADKISEAAVNNYQNIFQTVPQQVQQYTYSMYLKKAQNDRCVLFAGSSQALLWIDMTNWTSFSQTNVNSYSINAVGDGWYRVEFSYTNTASGSHQTGINLIQIGTTNTTTYSGNTANGLFIWGAQVNIGSTAKPYFPTTDRLNVPRLTYQNGGGGCPSLLLEKQSTNLTLYSEDFSNAEWKKGDCTITANAITSPDGTQNADLLIGNNGVVSADLRTQNAFIVTIGASYTWSLYVKSAGYRYFGMTAWTADDPLTIYDLTNISVISESGPSHTSTITDVGNGWRRITITRTSTSTIGWLRCTPLANSTGSAAQNGTDGAYIWGAQVEASSYPTSYIPTTSASATRVADFATTNNISSLFGSTEGSFFIEMTADFTNTNGSIPLFLRSSINSTFNRATFLQFGSGTIALNVYLAGALQASIFSGTYTQGQKLKIAFAYKQNDFVLYINGTLMGTDTSGDISASLSFIDLGTYSLGASDFQYNGAISEAVLFPTRLTNTQLAQLTA
jgi:hypothetical protein